MALMAQVTIKMPGELVPITGQTLGVGLIGATLGAAPRRQRDEPLR